MFWIRLIYFFFFLVDAVICHWPTCTFSVRSQNRSFVFSACVHTYGRQYGHWWVLKLDVFWECISSQSPVTSTHTHTQLLDRALPSLWTHFTLKVAHHPLQISLQTGLLSSFTSAAVDRVCAALKPITDVLRPTVKPLSAPYLPPTPINTESHQPKTSMAVIQGVSETVTVWRIESGFQWSTGL